METQEVQRVQEHKSAVAAHERLCPVGEQVRSVDANASELNARIYAFAIAASCLHI